MSTLTKRNVLRPSRKLPCDHTWVHVLGLEPGERFTKRCGTCHHRYYGRLIPLIITSRGIEGWKIEWETQ